MAEGAVSPPDSIGQRVASPLLRRGRVPSKLRPGELDVHLEDEDRKLLRFEINCALVFFLEQERSVYLEGLGLLTPTKAQRLITHTVDHWALLRDESVREIQFEKCDDSSCLPESARGAAETRDLARRIYPRLPLPLQFRWTESDLKRLLRALLLEVRSELLQDGYSHMLSSVGTLYALHNRCGQNLQDWYGGSDIFLRTRHHQTVTVQREILVERPVLESAWEVMQAAFGPPQHQFEFSPKRELEAWGVEPPAEAPEMMIKVAAFHDTVTGRVLFCTDGLRTLKAPEAKAGSELVVQLPAGNADDAREWITRPLSMGWFLTVTSRHGALRPGLGLAAPAPLSTNPACQLTAILTTRLSDLGSEQLSAGGAFHYLNVIGITTEEAQLLQEQLRPYLLAVLEHKRLDQITDPRRSSILRHTYIQSQRQKRAADQDG